MLSISRSRQIVGVTHPTVSLVRFSCCDIYCFRSKSCFLTDTSGENGESPLVQGLGTLYHAIRTTGPANLVAYIGNFLSVQVSRDPPFRYLFDDDP